jgi:LysM repeat protein
MKKLIVVILSGIISFTAVAQGTSVQQYIQQYKDIAIAEMKRMGVPAAITLAQGILESQNGNSDLVKQSNNHFGIKCKNTWTGDSVIHDDDMARECFRAYKTAEESFRDHSNFLRGSSRYEFLFHIDASDYRSWANGLKKAGYATNPSYPAILIRNIEQYNLQQYTVAALKDLPNFDASKYSDDKEDTVRLQASEKVVVNAADSNVASILDIPDKIIIINNCKCVAAKKGTSLLFLATKNNINLNKLLEYNELAEDGILGKDQLVYLQKKQKTGELEFHIVQPGESIYDIAQKNGIQLQYLLGYNKLGDGDVLNVGDKLKLQPVKIIKKDKKEQTLKLHTVAPREGLYGIAKKYNVTVDQLREWNKLESNELRVGQSLIIAK